MLRSLKYLNNPFGYCVFFFLAFGAPLLFIFPKGQIVLYFNDLHSLFPDMAFKYITYLGDGIVLLFLFLLFLAFSYYYSVVALFSSAFVLLLSQGLKRTLFQGWPRPTAFFDDSVKFNFVEGVEVHSYNTFPSGHSITAFATFFMLSFVAKDRYLQILIFFVALMVAISRVYLLQHFFVDIYFGCILGMLSVLLGIFVTNRVLGGKRADVFKKQSIFNR